VQGTHGMHEILPAMFFQVENAKFVVSVDEYVHTWMQLCNISRIWLQHFKNCYHLFLFEM